MASDPSPRIKLKAHQLTDVGVVRDHNEDSAYVDERMEFFVVADGMGGHAAGEVASHMAVERVREHLEAGRDLIAGFSDSPTEDSRKALVALLEASVRKAHQAVFDTGAKETDKQGMGTTLDVVLLAGSEAFVAHVGDSRTYLVREGKAAQLTTDHTVAEVLVIEGKLSLEEAQVSPLRTILVNAIGVAPDVGVEMAHVRLRAGDRLLICSDGLHDYFPAEQELADQIHDREPEAALSEMVDTAKNRGGHDNITGVLLQVLEVPRIPGDEETVETQSMPAVSPDGVPKGVDSEDTLPVEESDDSILRKVAREAIEGSHIKRPEPAKSDESSSKARGDDEATVPLRTDDVPEVKKRKRRRRKRRRKRPGSEASDAGKGSSS